MNTVLPLAEKMLKRFGEFYPYGAYMKPNGEIVDVGVTEETEHPKSKELLDTLRHSFSELAAAGKCKATAIVLVVRVELPGTQQNSDAIQICLEHADGYSAQVFLPYTTTEDAGITYGETFAQQGDHEVFGRSA